MSVKIVAHRGESQAAPENTLEAFTLAWMRGARCIEGDFHLSRDGEIVCMHDDNAKRTCDVDRPLAELTLTEIKQLDAGIHKGEEWRYTRVPTLREILQGMPADGEIYIELKSVGPIVDALKTLFAGGPWRPEQLTFIAFDEATIHAAKQLFPAHRAYWLTGNNKFTDSGEEIPRFTPEELVAKLRELEVDGVDIMEKFVTADYVNALHDAGFSFHVWTVDSVERARELIRDGVDSITSNRAYALRCELGCHHE